MSDGFAGEEWERDLSWRRILLKVSVMSATFSAAINYSSVHMEGVACQSFADGQVSVYSCRSPEKESVGAEVNEDVFAILPVSATAGVLAVADGCGGQSNGLEAAHRAIQSLADCVSKVQSPELIRVAILDGFEAAAKRVAEVGNGAATTMIAVEINGGLLRTYHVGDSQVMVVGSRGRVKLQTRAHSPVGYAVEAGMLSEDDAIGHADRHIVSNVVGSPESHIDIGMPRPLSPRDTVIIGSDGLYDNLTQAEIAELIRKGPIETAAEQLRQAVAKRMAGVDPTAPSKPDDFTFIMFRPTANRSRDTTTETTGRPMRLSGPAQPVHHSSPISD